MSTPKPPVPPKRPPIPQKTAPVVSNVNSNNDENEVVEGVVTTVSEENVDEKDITENADVIETTTPAIVAESAAVSDPAPVEEPIVVADDPDSPENKKKRIRTKVAEEILSTEKAYVNSLSNVVEFIIPTFSNVFDYETTQLVFSSISILLDLNRNLCSEFEKRIASWDATTSTIGDLFITFSPYLKMYGQYASNYDQAVQKLVNLERKQSDRYEKLVEKLANEPRLSGEELNSLLIKPIQRIPRYRLLLSELLKHTNNTHPDYKDIVLALEHVEAVATKVNEAIRLQQSRMELIGIQKEFGKDVEIFMPTRRLVKKGRLIKLCRKDEVMYEIFLFNDCLIYATRNTMGLKFHRQLSVADGGLAYSFCPPEIKKDKACFAVRGKEKSFILIAASQTEADMWIDSMKADLKCVDYVDTTGNYAPVWQHDHEANNCPLCQQKFTLFNRRHHCRLCGILCDADCSKHRLKSPVDSSQMRVCNSCEALRQARNNIVDPIEENATVNEEMEDIDTDPDTDEEIDEQSQQQQPQPTVIVAPPPPLKRNAPPVPPAIASPTSASSNSSISNNINAENNTDGSNDQHTPQQNDDQQQQRNLPIPPKPRAPPPPQQQQQQPATPQQQPPQPSRPLAVPPPPSEPLKLTEIRRNSQSSMTPPQPQQHHHHHQQQQQQQQHQPEQLLIESSAPQAIDQSSNDRQSNSTSPIAPPPPPPPQAPKSETSQAPPTVKPETNSDSPSSPSNTATDDTPEQQHPPHLNGLQAKQQQLRKVGPPPPKPLVATTTTTTSSSNTANSSSNNNAPPFLLRKATTVNPDKPAPKAEETVAKPCGVAGCGCTCFKAPAIASHFKKCQDCFHPEKDHLEPAEESQPAAIPE